MQGDGTENNQQTEASPQLQPGMVITPQTVAPEQNVAAPAPVADKPAPQANPEPAATQVEKTPVQPVSPYALPTPQVEEQPAQDIPAEGLMQDDEGMSWLGPEFIPHEKSANWYLSLLGIVVIIGVALYFITKGIVSSIAVDASILILGVYSMRKPRQISYTLDRLGITVGARHFAYEEFRAFTAAIEGGHLSVTFIPARRFALPAGLCYLGADEGEIVDFLSDRLPLEQHKPDMIERFMLSVRF